MNLLPKSALALSIAACLGGPVWAQQAVEAEGDASAESAAEIGADIAAEAQQIVAEARAQAAAMVDAARAEADALRATAQTDSAAALARHPVIPTVLRMDDLRLSLFATLSSLAPPRMSPSKTSRSSSIFR
ncbi:MAG: hypothetical protein AAFQ06_05935, partial [Pseudomonadota bacterium]